MRRYEKKILDIICNSVAHLTAEEIFLLLKKTEPKVVMATIYNNLNELYSSGRIRKVSMEGSPDRYDRLSRHDHLVCKQCGRLSDMTFEDFTKKIESQLGEDIVGYDLKVFYICPACKEKR